MTPLVTPNQAGTSSPSGRAAATSTSTPRRITFTRISIVMSTEHKGENTKSFTRDWQLWEFTAGAEVLLVARILSDCICALALKWNMLSSTNEANDDLTLAIGFLRSPYSSRFSSCASSCFGLLSMPSMLEAENINPFSGFSGGVGAPVSPESRCKISKISGWWDNFISRKSRKSQICFLRSVSFSSTPEQKIKMNSQRSHVKSGNRLLANVRLSQVSFQVLRRRLCTFSCHRFSSVPKKRSHRTLAALFEPKHLQHNEVRHWLQVWDFNNTNQKLLSFLTLNSAFPCEAVPQVQRAWSGNKALTISWPAQIYCLSNDTIN